MNMRIILMLGLLLAVLRLAACAATPTAATALGAVQEEAAAPCCLIRCIVPDPGSDRCCVIECCVDECCVDECCVGCPDGPDCPAREG